MNDSSTRYNEDEKGVVNSTAAGIQRCIDSLTNVQCHFNFFFVRNSALLKINGLLKVRLMLKLFILNIICRILCGLIIEDFVECQTQQTFCLCEHECGIFHSIIYNSIRNHFHVVKRW